jgi:hypothetical protein
LRQANGRPQTTQVFTGKSALRGVRRQFPVTRATPRRRPP